MSVKILIGDALAQLQGLADESVQCCVTSPPYYGLRCYGTEGQIGLEATPEAHIARLVEVFREVRRVLRKDGVLWLNYGDAYATTANGRSAADTKAAGNDDRTFRDKPFSTVGHGAKPKDLLMLPARVALALQADGWWLRSMLPWVKRSAMPESVTDRPATAIEYVFLLTRSARYFWDGGAVRHQDGGGASGNGFKRPHRLSYGDRGQEEQWNPGGGRNFRNSDLFYASLEPPHGLISGEDGAPLALDVNPAGFGEAHFATFPPKLIEPLIKVATSEKGCCPACGAPWVREVEKPSGGATGNSWHDHSQDETAGNSKVVRSDGYQAGKTLGWSPSCGCDPLPDYVKDEPAESRAMMLQATAEPCTVLDPFGGAGTTGLVADRLGRNAILIELNPEYAAMARKRIAGDAPLFAEVLRQAQDEGGR